MSASQVQPIVADRSPSESVIRDLYALAAFYVANPGHPRPMQVSVTHVLHDVEELQRLAHEFDEVAMASETDGHWFFFHRLRHASISISLHVRTDPQR